jgi:hypothetical protein
MKLLPKGPWRVVILTWIVFTPYYTWLGLSAIYASLPSPSWIGLVFGIYLIFGFLAVRALLRILNRWDESRKSQARDS